MTSGEKWSPLKQGQKIKLQKLHTSILKAVSVISKASDSSIKLKKHRNLNKINFKESLSLKLYDCMDSIAMLSHVNFWVEQNRRNNIAFTLDKQ